MAKVPSMKTHATHTTKYGFTACGRPASKSQLATVKTGLNCGVCEASLESFVTRTVGEYVSEDKLALVIDMLACSNYTPGEYREWSRRKQDEHAVKDKLRDAANVLDTAAHTIETLAEERDMLLKTLELERSTLRTSPVVRRVDINHARTNVLRVLDSLLQKSPAQKYSYRFDVREGHSVFVHTVDNQQILICKLTPRQARQLVCKIKGEPST